MPSLKTVCSLAYCHVVMMFGLGINMAGPLLPQLADWHHTSKEHMSFVFTAGALGCTVGGPLAGQLLATVLRQHALYILATPGTD